MPEDRQPEVSLRRATPQDAAVCGQICFHAFATINQAHGFAVDFPRPEIPTQTLSMLFSSPGFYCVVAEDADGILGSNCVDERSVIAGIGPITIDPRAQNLGIGRKLMLAVMEHAERKGSAGM